MKLTRRRLFAVLAGAFVSPVAPVASRGVCPVTFIDMRGELIDAYGLKALALRLQDEGGFWPTVRAKND